MRDLAELVAGWLYALRITSGPQWVLRVGVLACGMGAAALGWLWFPMILSTALLVAGSVLTLAAAVRPDSGAALGVVAVVAITIDWTGFDPHRYVSARPSPSLRLGDADLPPIGTTGVAGRQPPAAR